MHKASKSVKTWLIAPVILATALLAAGCDTQDDVHHYENTDSCAAAGVYTKETCKSAYEAALAQHKISAPKYDDQKKCEEEWGDGKCDINDGAATDIQPAEPPPAVADGTQTAPTSSGSTAVVHHHHYSPWFYGYGMSGGGSGSSSAAPIYRSRSGSLSSSLFNHSSSGSGSSFSSGSRSSYSSSTRGGFGGTARGFSGGHSSFGG